ncbi:GTP pyrophosphokinase [Geodia barretti]|uniref:Putative GTP diphosphokinase RSH1, chloroplastic n=1 Tax=Geodia barretti TaxID=519541 RepID=A0AA35TKN0_GEOBA|nr:GTP pyrophosphokinase [Geodia barretti]
MMLTIDSVVTAVEQYHPQADTDLIRRAYLFAAEAHKHQKRKSGIPYISHPLEVASILTELQMDAMTIASALLHDTIEDTDAGEEQIASDFSPDVAALVSGVTKLSKLDFFSQEERQAESFRKMLVAMAKDIRVILVKLADRLHNLRTLEHMAGHKQRLVARETLEIYAPLAHRLGITWMKAEMEDLSFLYLHPRAYQEIEAQFTGEQDASERYLAQVQETVAKELTQMRIDCRLSGRPKHYYSIYQKMQRQQLPFEEVHDLLAVRVITDTVRNCYAILGIIHALWKPIPGRFKDYIALPKPNMYQSLHTIVLGPERQRIELQIRTEEMHRTAEEGIAAHWHYKERGSTEENEEYFAWLRQLIEWQQDLKDPIEFMETVKIDMFPEEVYVFTPRGEVKTFPRGATAVDFAYSVHTDVGHQCTGAKVNGRMVPLRYQLRNGDTIEVLTSTSHVPNRDWLRWVVTPRARTRIKAWLKSEDKERSIALGMRNLEHEIRKYTPNPQPYVKTDVLLAAAPAFGCHRANDLLEAVGYGRVSALQVAHRLLPSNLIKEKTKQGKAVAPSGRQQPRSEGVRVHGLTDVLINFARCCSPLPGDRIVGYVTRGRGVSVHTTDCESTRKLEYDAERRTSVSWDDAAETLHPAAIALVTHDEQGVLANVSAAVSACKVNISRFHTTTTMEKKAYMDITVDVRDVNHLNEVIRRIEGVRGVLSVERARNVRRGNWHT